MSTFPRRIKATGVAPTTTAATASTLLTRGTSFDAGINSSTAWTEHLERELDALSFEDIEKPDGSGRQGLIFADLDKVELHKENVEDAVDVDGAEIQSGQPARVLYDFDGKEEYNELVLKAGEDIEVLTEDVAEGWSLARVTSALDAEDGNPDEGDRECEVGLVPRTYFAYIEVDMNAYSGVDDSEHTRDASSHTATPRASVALPATSTPPPAVPSSLSESTSSSAFLPLLPQNTGEWFRQQLQLSAMRRSLLGGKSLNRFSSFVTSGAEDYILNGPSDLPPPANTMPLPDAAVEGLPVMSTVFHARERTDASLLAGGLETEKHYIDIGPTWKADIPPFVVRVHSPEKRQPVLEAASVGAYTVYSVTSVFSTPEPNAEALESSWQSWHHPRFASATSTGSSSSDSTVEGESGHIMTVQRRFSHFVFLHNALKGLLPGIALPPLPEKQYAGRFSESFVEARRGELERYINKLVRHPLVRSTDLVMFFLSCDNDVEWKRQLPHYTRRPPLLASFYTNVYHPAFHIDVEEAEETAERFRNHAQAVNRGMHQFRNIYGKVRAARVEMSNAERMLSYSLLSLITSTPLASSSLDEEEDEEDESPMSLSVKGQSCRQKKGLTDADGAWCWRDDCADCLRLTKCVQKTAETYQGIADLYDLHARRTMLSTHESMKSASHPDKIYAPILDIHDTTISRYRSVTEDTTKPNEEVAARCETVLNTTMAEFDTYHTQKKEDFERLTKDLLDNEIQFYEKALSRLRTTRALFDASSQEHELTMPGPRFPSVFERDLHSPKLSTAPLTEPCPHVLDPSSMRPVSSALHGVGAMFSSSTGSFVASNERSSTINGRDSASVLNGRGSVFSRFW